MELREIRQNEVQKLYACVQGLSEHHNQVSVHFKGAYPSRPYEDTLNMFEESMKASVSKIAVMEQENDAVGFCKVDMENGKGKLDYLMVMPEYRGKELGKQLMDWAMVQFHENNIRRIEVKVVDGNDAIHLYEKYGFKMNAHLLWYEEG